MVRALLWVLLPLTLLGSLVMLSQGVPLNMDPYTAVRTVEGPAQTLAQKEMPQSFLFAGPKGAGKTSAARIVARAVNCTDLQDGEPCGKCANCQEILRGSSLDVLEIDAERLEPPPPNLETQMRNCLSGVCPLKDRLLLVLDTGRTVDVTAAYSQNGPERTTAEGQNS